MADRHTGAHESTPARTKREWRARNGEPARTNWHRAETNRLREPDETCPFKTHYNDQQTSTRGLHREAQETVT